MLDFSGNPPSPSLSRTVPATPDQALGPLRSYLQAGQLVALCVRSACHLHDSPCGCETCSYRLVEMARAGGEIRERAVARLPEISDLGHISALEIVLEDARKRLRAEEAHQRFQEKEFRAGWHRCGHALECTRPYNAHTVQEQRAKTAKHVARLRNQLRRLEEAVARNPTPPELLLALRRHHDRARAEVARRYVHWEAELITAMASGK